MVTQFTFSYKGGVISESIFNFRNMNQITVHQLFNLEIINQNLRLTNGHFTTISSQFSAIYMNTFPKTEVQTRLSSRTLPSREVPGRSRDGTGQDLETLKVPWSCGPGTKEVQKSRDFF